MSADDYLAHYKSQHGGGMRFYRGGVQTGAGIGGILRRVFRFIMPVATTGLKSFATNALGGLSAGMPLLNAAKSAIGPAVEAVAGPLISRFMNNTPADTQQQPSATGGGGDQKGSGSLFDGENGIPTAPRSIAAYKKGHGGAVQNIIRATVPGKKSGGAKKRKGTNKTITYNF